MTNMAPYMHMQVFDEKEYLWNNLFMKYEICNNAKIEALIAWVRILG